MHAQECILADELTCAVIPEAHRASQSIQETYVAPITPGRTVHHKWDRRSMDTNHHNAHVLLSTKAQGPGDDVR
jgi:hypothetical protein